MKYHHDFSDIEIALGAADSSLPPRDRFDAQAWLTEQRQQQQAKVEQRTKADWHKLQRWAEQDRSKLVRRMPPAQYSVGKPRTVVRWVGAKRRDTRKRDIRIDNGLARQQALISKAPKLPRPGTKKLKSSIQRRAKRGLERAAHYRNQRKHWGRRQRAVARRSA